jgi:hypothetical protein
VLVVIAIDGTWQYYTIRSFIVRLFQNWIKILALFLCISVSCREAIAGVSWEKDLVYDVNTNSSPLASCINKDTNGVIVMTKVGPKGTFLSDGGDCILWEIGAGGNIVRKVLLKDASGNAIKTNALAAGLGCAMASDSFGNLVTIGVLGEQRKERAITVISAGDTIEPNILTRNKVDEFSVKKLIPFHDNTFLLVGGRSGEGLYMRIDNEGRIIKEKLFNRGQHELFTGASRMPSDSSYLIVVGISAKNSNKMSFDGSPENFILLYDPNDKVIYEDYFTGGDSVMLQPKVCCLDNGDIVIVFYNKPNKDSKAGLWARYYTQELKLLWEKQLFDVDNPIFFFDVTSCKTDGFVVGIGQIEGLKFYFLNKNGTQIDSVRYKGMAGIPGFNLMRVNGKTIAVFEEGSEGNIKEMTIKAKVIALN